MVSKVVDSDFATAFECPRLNAALLLVSQDSKYPLFYLWRPISWIPCQLLESGGGGIGYIQSMQPKLFTLCLRQSDAGWNIGLVVKGHHG